LALAAPRPERKLDRDPAPSQALARAFRRRHGTYPSKASRANK
jgi:hypothetical protein